MERPEARPNIIPVDHETSSSATRTTANNRTLTYQMRVLQQPIRARACGQGAKSSADRRPVDPPPIVDLRVFDGDNDITFSIRANYFLFATLEHARPMAHGRVSSERTTPPVLTGTPVAGMVYLDRPAPAGYFIFPDLSVRHEGVYRLSFSLYEETKDFNDQDKPQDGSALNAADDNHVTHRLEVRSEPFTVFSAKKFPGLTESTMLSRTVAEQGCRVRIRRDVRMRRRDTKAAGKDWDEYEEDTAQARARMSGTPDPNAYSNYQAPHGYIDPVARPRSASNTSHQSFAGPISRRPSLQDMNQAFSQPHYGKAPPTPQNYAQPTPYGPAPSPQYQPPYMHQQTAMQPPPPQYQSQAYQASPPSGPAPAQPGYYGHPPPPPPPSQAPAPSYGVPPPPPPPAAYESAPTQHHLPDYGSQYAQHDHRRSSATVSASSSTGYSHGSYPSMSSQQQYQPPPIPRPAPLEPRTQSIVAPHVGRSSLELPPLNTTLASTRLEASSPVSALPPSTAYHNATLTPVDSHKRSYASVFRDPYQNQPLRHGARPGTSYGASSDPNAAPSLSAAADNEADDAHAEYEADLSDMRYRRADGRQIRRALPAHN